MNANRKLNDVKPMTKERANFLKEKYKNDEDIDYSDIPEINFELLETGVYKMVDWPPNIHESEN
jgi:hypothetical protein